MLNDYTNSQKNAISTFVTKYQHCKTFIQIFLSQIFAFHAMQRIAQKKQNFDLEWPLQG